MDDVTDVDIFSANRPLTVRLCRAGGEKSLFSDPGGPLRENHQKVPAPSILASLVVPSHPPDPPLREFS